MVTLKESQDLETRKASALAIREKHPDRIPCIVEKRARDNSLPDIDKKKCAPPLLPSYPTLPHSYPTPTPLLPHSSPTPPPPPVRLRGRIPCIARALKVRDASHLLAFSRDHGGRLAALREARASA